MSTHPAQDLGRKPHRVRTPAAKRLGRVNDHPRPIPVNHQVDLGIAEASLYRRGSLGAPAQDQAQDHGDL